jgi:hypothetical protein
MRGAGSRRGQARIIYTGTGPPKLYTICSPPNHRDGVVHPTRSDAEAVTEHFDGKTSE